MSFDRRSFLKAGAGASVASLVGANILQVGFPHPVLANSDEAQLLTNTFVVDANVFAQIDQTNDDILNIAPWGLPPEFDFARSTMPESILPTEAMLNHWVTQNYPDCETNTCAATSRPTDLSLLNKVMHINTTHIPDIANVAGYMSRAILESNPLDVDLEFLYSPNYEDALPYKIFLPAIDSTGMPENLGQTMVPSVTSLPEDLTSYQARYGRWSVDLYGWKFQFRGPEYHPLGKCVKQDVTHYNLEIFKHRGGGRYDYIVNFHIGAYRSGGRLCFVLWNNKGSFQICWKICSPTYNQLIEIFKWVVLAAAAIAAVALAWWLVGVIAGSLAGAAWVPLLALA